MKKILFLILFVSVFVACKKQHSTSFYFWKATYKISSFEQSYLDSLNVEKLYVRFFDVDVKNGKAIPVGEISIEEKNVKQEIIPVVFIANEVFKDFNKKAIEELAQHIDKEIKFIYPKISDNKLKEIQFDCDWTVSTRNKYFYFLNIVEKQNPSLLVSVTIRLHQIKDAEQTGVPSVKKAVLMYYATSNPLNFKDENSILENTIANNYIKDLKKYPIDLDIALPIYSWAIVQNQVGEKRLINGIRKQDLRDTSLYQPLKPNFYQIKKDHYLKGNYLYEDFILKTEEISQLDLELAKKNSSSKMKNKELTTIFFQLDSSNLVQYSIQDFKTISK